MKFDRNVLQVNMHQLTESKNFLSNDGGHDVISRSPAARCCKCGCGSVCRLPASQPSAYDVSFWSKVHSHSYLLYIIYYAPTSLSSFSL